MPSAPAEPWYIVRQSSIHNQGVFAARDVPKGTRIIDYKGHKVTKAESIRRGTAQIEGSAVSGEGAVYIFVLNKKHDIDGNVPWNDARLINHTCEPNCEAQIIRGTIWLIATKDIPEGTELGFNYGFDLETWEDHPCLCRTKSCCGYIVGKEYWPKLKRLVKKRDQVIAAGNAQAEAAVKKPDGSRKSQLANKGWRPPPGLPARQPTNHLTIAQFRHRLFLHHGVVWPLRHRMADPAVGLCSKGGFRPLGQDRR